MFARSSMLGSLVLAAALSTAACASPTGEDTSTAPEAPEQTGSVSSAVETKLSPVVKLATLVAGQLLGKTIANQIFPYDKFDYDRIANDAATAAENANIKQTVTTEAGKIQGKLKSLSDIETLLAATTPISNAEAYGRIDNTWSGLDQSLGILSTDPNVEAGLPIYVTGAQVKLSMFAKLVQLDPAMADTNTRSLKSEANRFFDNVVTMKRGIETKAFDKRIAEIGECREGVSSSWVLPDGQRWYTFNLENSGTSDETVLANQCRLVRGDLIARAGVQTLSEVTSKAPWIDDVLKEWADITGRPNLIRVKSATYGGNVGQPRGNVTPVLASVCNNKNECAYTVDSTKLGDRAFMQQKTFELTYTCYTGGVGESAEKTVSLPAEASGKSFTLSCH
jgi:hypothetical protein